LFPLLVRRRERDETLSATGCLGASGMADRAPFWKKDSESIESVSLYIKRYVPAGSRSAMARPQLLT
jgi:hypothetical protein